METLYKLFSILQNGQISKKTSISVSSSKPVVDFLELLWRKGYIYSFTWSPDPGKAKPSSVPQNRTDLYGKLYVLLKYKDSEPLIKKVKIISHPGCRKYYTVKELKQKQKSCRLIILSTTQGILSEDEALSYNLGGEVLCELHF